MILMSGQGRAPGEGLLAVGVRALVRTLSRVNSSVPGQGAGIREWLQMD